MLKQKIESNPQGDRYKFQYTIHIYILLHSILIMPLGPKICSCSAGRNLIILTDTDLNLKGLQLSNL